MSIDVIREGCIAIIIPSPSEIIKQRVSKTKNYQSSRRLRDLCDLHLASLNTQYGTYRLSQSTFDKSLRTKMERALPPPTFIRQFGTPKHLDPNETYDLLSSFLLAQTSKAHYAPSTQTSQLERLTDVIGIQIGAVDPTDAEEHERERERLEAEERDRLKKAREEALGVQEEEAEEMVKEEEQQVAEQRDEDDEDELDDGEEDEADSDEEGAPLPGNEKGQEQDELEDEDEDVDMK